MSAIAMTGALSMISTNGDGAQLLAEAAAFVTALAALNVPMAVEIQLRPLSVAGLPTLDPTPAVRSKPEGPLLDDYIPWSSQMTRNERKAAVLITGRAITQHLGHGLSMGEWDANRPMGYPPAKNLPKTYGPSWTALREAWAQ